MKSGIGTMNWHRVTEKISNDWISRQAILFTLIILQNNSGLQNEIEVTGILNHATSKFRVLTVDNTFNIGSAICPSIITHQEQLIVPIIKSPFMTMSLHTFFVIFKEKRIKVFYHYCTFRALIYIKALNVQ